MGINRYVGAGRITNDLEIRIGQSGKENLFFTIAIDEGTKEKPATHYQDCVAYGQMAQTIAKWLIKGDQIMVEGKNHTYTVDDRGEKRKRHHVVVEKIEFGQKVKRPEDLAEKNVERPDGITDFIKGDDIPWY